MIVLGVDPGNTTGLVIMEAPEDKIVRLHYFVQVEYKNICRVLHNLNLDWFIDVVVIEDYRIKPHLARANAHKNTNRGEAMRVIGAVEGVFYPIKPVFQDSSILATTQLQSEVKMPAEHSKGQWVSAYNHAFYYLRKHELIKTPLEIRGSNV
jgi:hypothetical protein